MILIIEGPDLSGKSYAIEKIGKHFNSGLTLKNNYKPKTSDDKEIYLQYWKILKAIDDFTVTTDIVILDRFYPSQAVYSVLRGLDEMGGEHINSLDNFMKNMPVVYVYIDTPLNILEERYKERGDEHIKIGELKALKERYDLFYVKTEMQKIKIDTTKKDWMVLVEEVVGRIRTEITEMKRQDVAMKNEQGGD